MILELIKNRRFWAGFFASVTFILQLNGVNISLDATSLTDSILQIINGVSILLTCLLPIWSLIKPKESQIK